LYNFPPLSVKDAMKIHSFQFENKNLGLKINPIHFSDLSLLVGVSGVGKTIILDSISELKKIAMV
jgi:ABC-type sugar transport system ATPase subunit